MKCKACRRLLTDPISRLYGYGPSCLKRAVSEGNAPIEALEEQKTYRKLKKSRPERQAPVPERCEKTLDLFQTLKNDALHALHKAVAECVSLGINVKVSADEEEAS